MEFGEWEGKNNKYGVEKNVEKDLVVNDEPGVNLASRTVRRKCMVLLK